MIELTNQLSEESSPYLQAHQQHPVAWQTWQPDVLAAAKKLNRPIVLSIGYSACHWCHLMARETFSDPLIADLMNANFINIKVDREERPDLDEVYQTAHQMLTGRPGGWPLTMFLCPQTQIPFLAGTYFPRDGRDGLLGFDDLLQRVYSYYTQQQSDFKKLRGQVESSFQQLMQPQEGQAEPTMSDLLAAALKGLEPLQDKEYGGFGRAPKFPMPVNLSFLLQQDAYRRLSVPGREHLYLSLDQMAQRGINDRIGGGFFRYSTDNDWNIPHFEKMLYDNGMLLEVYARAWLQTDMPLYKSAAIGIVRWLRQHMLTQHGTFFSSMDAETDGREGDYYTLPADDLKTTLSTEEFRLFEQMFGLRGEPNFAGRWHLSQKQDLNTAARQLTMTREEALRIYRQGREKIELLRAHKSLPLIDNKVLTSCNSLVIKGLLILARKDSEMRELALAQGALDFIHDRLWVNGRLFSAWQGEQPQRHAFLDDYAYLLDALLESLQTSWRDRDYRFAIALAEAMLRLHEDAEQGGFYYTANDAEMLIYRSKPYLDSVLPSANGVAARALLRLGQLTAEPRYLQAVNRLLSSALAAMQQSPQSHLTLVQVQEERRSPRPQVLMLDDGKMHSWQANLHSMMGERIICYRLPEDAELYPTEALGMEPGEAMVCVGDRCLPVQRTANGLIHQLTELLA